LRSNWNQEKITTGVLAVEVNPSFFAMVLIKVQNLHPKSLMLMRTKQLGYARAKKLVTLLFVMVLTAN